MQILPQAEKFKIYIVMYLSGFRVGSSMCKVLLQDGTPTTKTFDHVPSEIGAEEAEEVGVEHLLRCLK